MNKRVGAAAAWVDAVETLGSGKLTAAEVLAPAIRLAEEGSVINIPLLIAPSLLTTHACRVPVSEIHSYNVSSAFVHVRLVANLSTVAALGRTNTKCVAERT